MTRVPAAILGAVLAACIDPTGGDSTAPSSYDDVVLRADVASNEGIETIRASIAAVTVVDARGAVLASTPAFDPQGSADEVVGIRVIFDANASLPMIAVTTTVGGHRENTTYTALYRVSDRSLDTLFVGPIEHVEGSRVESGLLLVFPQTLLYRAPNAELATMQSFDASAHRFVVR